ncbi:DUF5317 domain-containing protein [Alicyclobacillus sp. SP_1]|uniref:DUF5317 domain-containing protein n=1 Tax=Alicyclobacillus sp. SP_1 TaxID=2942475 RepID=UPI002157A5EA|nr:DUF5317 domain-containing protein [Alicyclobacillus sp. SP_1]
MAFEGLSVICGLVIGFFRRGSFASLSTIRLRMLWMVILSYVLQFVSIHVGNHAFYGVLMILSYTTLILFCVLNIKQPGVWMACVGTALNFLEMSANGLRMPAYLPAVRSVNRTLAAELLRGNYGKSVVMTKSTFLPFLGDIIPIHIYPQSVVSIGDCLFSIGIIVFIVYSMTGMVGVADND